MICNLYTVDDTNLKNSTLFNSQNIWPSCLPKEKSEYVNDNGKQVKGYTSGEFFLYQKVLFLPANLVLFIA
jgi:hypothetical protein